MTLERGGLRLGAELLPFYAGAVHYWRLSPERWRPCLEAVRALGLALVDVYVPWDVHELAPGKLDFGQHDPRLDVGLFLRLAHELGLRAIVRPGPHINAELTRFGVPHRVLWDPRCQARGPAGHPVVLPVPPCGFPVPSHASRAYLDEACRYLSGAGRQLASLRWPEGPIVMVQIDNEGALFFRDGAYDQDYHPDALAKYRSFLKRRYPDSARLRRVHGADVADQVEPPDHFDAEGADGLARHLDWAAFHEELIVDAFRVFAEALHQAGLRGIPTVHNLPMASETTPLNPAKLGDVVDLLGLDYYGGASERERALHARRTSELAVRCEFQDKPPIACEMGAGFPPYFPPLSPEDSAFTVLTALAYGLRGFNVFMAVERDRWFGAPVDSQGRAGPFAPFWRRLVRALREVEFHQLRRRVPVRLVVPRAERRLQRVLHAFGPATGAMLSVMGVRARDYCSEPDLGFGFPLVVGADEQAERWSELLQRLGVPFAWVAGEDGDQGLHGAQWILCATSGLLDGALRGALRRAAEAGARLSVGPHRPAYDQVGQVVEARSGFGLGDEVSWQSGGSPDELAGHVAGVVAELGIPCFPCEPARICATLHEDRAGRPRVLFVLNGGDAAPEVTVRLAGTLPVRRAVDALTGAAARVDASSIGLELPARTVVMLRLD